MTALVLLMGWLMIQPSVTFSSKQTNRQAKPFSQAEATPASPQTTGGTQSPNDAATPMGEEDAAISLSSEEEASPSPSEEAAAASPSEAGKWKSELPKLFTQNHPSQQKPRGTGAVFQPISRQVKSFPAVNVRKAAQLEALQSALPMPSETMPVDPPEDPPIRHFGVPILHPSGGVPELQNETTATLTPSFGTGVSPGSAKNFKGEFLSSTTIPPDTMGAVGTTHIVTSSNDRLRIQTRDGVEVSRVTMSSFWAGVTIKGVAASAFDTKVYFDRFNNRFILISSANGTSVNSGALFAVSATSDPTGTWYRWSVVADPASTGAPSGSGNWIDYPTVGFNKNWIVIDENVFHYTCNTTTCTNQSYFGQQVYVLDKQAAYSNTLSTINLFQADFNATCQTSATPESELACGFTMAPAITEDDTTDTEYLVEDWDSTAGQLRLSKITGTPSAPSLTVGTQFPQSSESWRFDAVRIGTTGGYAPQRQQSANLPSGSRIMANDSRIQNAVLRNNTLWATHTVMLASSSQPAGTTIGGTGNPVDNHSGIQWWQIDPTNETAASTAPLQRGRIHDPSANNCHNGTGGTSAVAPCNGTTSAQFGTFFAFPNISVNQNNDVLIGFTQFSPLTYASAAYAIRRAADPPNTTRDIVVFRPGQSNYNIGSGSGSSRQDRWGDYSAAQTDPLDDTNFWTVQEYAGTNRNDFLAPSYAGPWETWWAKVNPADQSPAVGNLIISEFRLRGPQGARDEFVELYNPNNTPIIVSTTDGSEGWALVYSANGTAFTQVFAVIPNGTVIPAHGHFLLADNPDNTAGGTSALTYSLNSYPSTQVRNADSDFGWSLDLADNGGIALFNTSTTANFSNTTRLDSVGFSSIAAGLFKEGNGIPAISTTTPTGQVTFYRDLSGGTPKDTGFNENDFIFANTVVGETLGSNPRLGAPGPENLSSPVTSSGATTLPAALVDTGVGNGSAPNLMRDSTAVTNGAFGTLTFRRAFTNNTGADLPRLRFRIVDMTTNPTSGSNADLRALSASATVVSLSGGGTANVAATSLETPPTQSAGGGINGTLTVPSVTLSTPFTSGATMNLQFTLGVQTTGNYNFCLVPESLTASTVASPLCFSGTTENTPPQITGGSASINAGAPATTPTIATVSDGQNSAGSLTVTAISVPSGISVTSISNTSGTVTANVSASCGLGSGAYNVILQVVDSEGATSNATFIVNVTATPAPTTPTISGTTNGTGTQDQACPEQLLTLNATSTGAVSYQWYSNNNLINGATSSTYQATGSATYYVTATNACGTTAQSAGYVVQNPTPHKPSVTANGPTTFCNGGSVTLHSDGPTGIQWYKDGVAIPGANSQNYVATASGSYTAQLGALGCHSTVSDAMVVTVNPLPPAPTINAGGPTTFCAGDSVTLTSSSASGNQWYLNGSPIGGATSNTYNATASGSYTVAVTDGNSCLSAASAATSVTVNPIPSTPTITPNGQATLCNGSATLTSSSATGNQWYLNGSPIGGATSNTYNATAAGDYTVVVTASGCSSAASAVTTVVANPAPVLSYQNQNLTFNGSLNISPATGPSDNTSISSIVVQSKGTYTGTITVDNTTGVISISNAAPAGTHTITIRATDSCGATTDASFTLDVQAPSPILGNYANQTVPLSGEVTVTPDAVPINTTRINVSTSTNFKGTFAADLSTGVVRVTDAHPFAPGFYTVTVTAFNGAGATTTKSFTLTVTTPVTCIPVSFAAATNFHAGGYSVAVGDFNNDGKQDIAAAGSNGVNGVSVLLGDGAGGFGAATYFGGNFYVSVAVGDFNNDGNQDLVVVSQTLNTVSVLLGDGAGNFGAATSYNVGTTPVSVAVGDFNGDGKLDVAVVNEGSNTVSVLLGNGDGSLGAATNFTVGSNPIAVAVGDFNNDGKQDLAVANFGTNVGSDDGNVSILLGNGAGSFGAATNFHVATPRSVAVGDFNNDGKQDIVTASNNNAVSVLLGNGAGSFGTFNQFNAGGTPDGVAVGDFNNDGNQDLAVANFGSADVSVLLGDGAGSFGNATNFAAEFRSTSVAVGDFNNDGKQDLAVANRDTENVSILLRDCPPANQTITVGTHAPANATYNTQFTVAATSTSGLPVTYSSAGVCTNVGATFTMTSGTGTCTVKYDQAGDSNHNAAPQVTESVMAQKAAAIITLSNLTQTYDGTAKFATATTNPSGLTINITYSQGGNPVSSPTNAGSYDIQATINDPNYQGSATGILVINKANQTITFNALPDKTYGDAPFTVSTTGGASGNTVTFSSQTPATCSVSGNTVSITAAGSCTVRASQAGDSNYNAATDVDRSFNIAKATSTTTVTVSDANYDGQPHGAMTAATGAGGLNQSLSVTYTGRNATTYNSTTPPTNAGDYTASASFAGDSNHNSSNDSKDFTINKATATVTLSNLAQTFDGTAKSASISTTPSGLTVNITYSQNSASVASPTDAGSYSVTATINDANYQGNTSGTLVINKATPTITWSNPSDITYGTALGSTQLNATASVAGNLVYTPASGTMLHAGSNQTLHVAFTPSDTTNYNTTSKDVVINVAKATLTVKAEDKSRAFGAANPTLTYTMTGFVGSDTQAGATTGQPSFSTTADSTSNVGSYPITVTVGTLTSSDYTFSFVNATLSVTKADQTITFGALSNKTYGDAAFTLSATASSGLSVAFSISSGPATINGNTVTITGSGHVVVRASQTGNTNYNAAPTVDRAFDVTAGSTTIALSNLSQTYDGNAKSPTATTTPSGLNVVFTYSQNNQAISSPTNVGNYNVTATIMDANYTGNTSDILSITQATPVITWNNPANITYGTPLSNNQLNATANTPGTFTYNPPAGTMLNVGPQQLTVSFTPSDTTNYTTATATVSITVNQVTTTEINLDSANYSVNEGDGHLTITVNRTGDISSAVTVDYMTSDTAALTPCNVFNGIASSRCDYATTVGTLHFAAGETSKQIYIPIVDDSYAEGSETFTITLSNAVGENLGAVSTATITIVDNDAVTGMNPLADQLFFIRQQYVDFLGREPDPVGFPVWQRFLANCPASGKDAQGNFCDRIEVSSDFFRSPEFQSRGYFIYRFYTTLGRHPFYSEFMPDMAKVSGFLSDQQLEANKVAYVTEFMARLEFQQKYGSITDPTAFVDALLSAVGLPNHPSGAAWITGLTNQTMTRAQVLRALIESTEVYNKFYNEAFVVMQYFGYLRRDPDSHYAEWIQTLNQLGDYRMMINGFLNSIEYGQRFGP